MPRPSNPTYLAFTAEAVKKARELGQEGVRDLPLMELDALKALSMYWNDLPRDDRKDPGEDAKFDAKFSAWLQEKSVWVPLRVLLDAKPEDLERAGYPSQQVTAFLDAFRALEKAETSSPGTVPQTATTSPGRLGPRPGRGGQQDHVPVAEGDGPRGVFNEANPFWKAPVRLRPGADPAGRQPGHSRRAEDALRQVRPGALPGGDARPGRGDRRWRSSASRCGS